MPNPARASRMRYTLFHQSSHRRRRISSVLGIIELFASPRRYIRRVYNTGSLIAEHVLIKWTAGESEKLHQGITDSRSTRIIYEPTLRTINLSTYTLMYHIRIRSTLKSDVIETSYAVPCGDKWRIPVASPCGYSCHISIYQVHTFTLVIRRAFVNPFYFIWNGFKVEESYDDHRKIPQLLQRQRRMLKFTWRE